MVVLPAPVEPTKATFWPGLAYRVMSRLGIVKFVPTGMKCTRPLVVPPSAMAMAAAAMEARPLESLTLTVP